ncbi:MAG: hypothetical protein OXE77_05230 [Flavobacteriaceae bacterium]|nr:hypothetical protein [Flavobacteriaceae bacterium]MCY4267430.1 hypothetical protein [Flavobacteriaceae bacterium]
MKIPVLEKKYGTPNSIKSMMNFLTVYHLSFWIDRAFKSRLRCVGGNGFSTLRQGFAKKLKNPLLFDKINTI